MVNWLTFWNWPDPRHFANARWELQLEYRYSSYIFLDQAIGILINAVIYIVLMLSVILIYKPGLSMTSMIWTGTFQICIYKTVYDVWWNIFNKQWNSFHQYMTIAQFMNAIIPFRSSVLVNTCND